MKTCHGASGLAILLSLVSAPSEAQQRETRPVEGFDAVEVGGGIDLEVRLGREYLVEVESEGDPAEIVTELRDRTLVVRRERSWSFFAWNDDDAAVHVTLPQLVALRASGGSDARAQGTFAGDKLEVAASGGSDVTIDVGVEELEATASGGSDLRLSGSARSARVHSSGGSDVNAGELTAEEADVHSSGGSDLTIAVRSKIVGNASGGSDILYSGQPQTVDVDSSGGSDVRRR